MDWFTRKIWLAVAIALVLGVASYGAYDRSHSTKHASGDAAAVIPSAEPSASPTPTPHRSTKPTSTASASSAASPTVRPTQAAVAAGPVETAANGTPLPRVGTYQVAVKGNENVKYGSFTVCDNSLPPTTTVAVSKATSKPGHSYNFDLAFYPGTQRHTERRIQRYFDDGSVTLTSESTTFTCANQTETSTTSYAPPQLRVAAHLEKGKTWKVKGGDGTNTEEGTFTVTGTDTIKVGSKTYPVWVIKSNLKLTGATTGTRAQGWWWSPELAMPLKITEKASATQSNATYTADVAITITGLPS